MSWLFHLTFFSTRWSRTITESTFRLTYDKRTKVIFQSDSLLLSLHAIRLLLFFPFQKPQTSILLNSHACVYVYDICVSLSLSISLSISLSFSFPLPFCAFLCLWRYCSSLPNIPLLCHLRQSPNYPLDLYTPSLSQYPAASASLIRSFLPLSSLPFHSHIGWLVIPFS